MARSSKSAGKGDAVPDDVLDRLYGAPPDEFVAHRNAAARELKGAGRAAAADAVRALRRPAAPAAAINQAVRANPAQARALLDAAGDLRRAHEAMMAGDQDRGTLKAAAAAERQAVNALAATAAAHAPGGRPASPDLERRIRDTLEAVALDPEVRERFAAGRLEQAARAAGLAMDLSPAGAAAPARESRRGDDRVKRDEQRRLRELEAAVRRAEDAVERHGRAVEAAEAARARADSTLREARKDLGEAKADLRRARRSAQRAGDSAMA